MDPVPLAIAFGPLALYLMLLGAVNLGRRPHLTTGTRDAVTLALAVSGLIVVGPINLFLPQGAVMRFGPLVWPLILVFCGLCVVLYLLVARPRLVAYNVTLEQLRPALDQAVRRLDSEARIAGDAVHLPQLTVQFHLDAAPTMRNVSLVATGDHQSHSGWKKLERELAAALANIEVAPNPRGFTFLAFGLVMIGWPVIQLVQMPHNVVAQRLMEILRM